MATAKPEPDRTPDGRYIVVDGRLWRATNPNLPAAERELHTKALMAARRAVRVAGLAEDPVALREARAQVHAAKVALGERGPLWWTDGTPDLNRRLLRNTPYAKAPHPPVLSGRSYDVDDHRQHHADAGHQPQEL